MKYSEKYAKKYTITLGGRSYNLSDTLDNLFGLNEEYDMSIVYTKGVGGLTLETCDNASGENVWEITAVPEKFGRTLYNKKLIKINTDIKQEQRIAFVMSNTITAGTAITYSNQYFSSGNNSERTDKAISSSFNNMCFMLDVDLNDFVIIVPTLNVTNGTTNKTMTLSELIEDADNWYLREVPNLNIRFRQGSSGQWISQAACAVYVNNENNMYNVYPVLFDYFNQIRNMTMSVYSNTNVPTATSRTTRNYMWRNSSDQRILAGVAPAFDFDWDRDIGSTLPAVNTIFKTESNDDFLRRYYFSTLTVSSGKVNNAVITSQCCLKGSTFLRELAYCGCFIGSEAPVSVADKAMWTENYWLGEMNKNGYTSGNLIRGDELEESETINKTGTIQRIDFNPDKKEEGDSDVLAQQTMGLGKQEAKFLKYYSMSSADVDALSADINSTTFSNPIQYIVSLTEYSPIISKFIDAFSTVENIHLGSWTAPNATGFRVNDSNGLFLAGSTQVDRMFNNFLDYSPYTMLNLYVPFCGTVQLPVDTFMGKTLSVWISFDIDSMKCLAMIFADGGYISNISGNLGKGYSISQTNYELYRLRALGGLFGVVTNLGSIALNPMSALGLPATVGGMINSFSKSYSTLKQGNSDYTDFRTPCKCCLFRSIPQLDDLTGFKKSVGIKCEKFGKLSEFHGFTVCRNPHINVSATEEEKEMLYSLLTTGVILP